MVLEKWPTPVALRDFRALMERCEAYSAAQRQFVPHKWYRISLDDTGNPQAEEASDPEPDYSCGGVQVTDDDALEYFLWDMGWVTEKHWPPQDEPRPDIMIAVRDIARGS